MVGTHILKRPSETTRPTKLKYSYSNHLCCSLLADGLPSSAYITTPSRILTDAEIVHITVMWGAAGIYAALLEPVTSLPLPSLQRWKRLCYWPRSLELLHS